MAGFGEVQFVVPQLTASQEWKVAGAEVASSMRRASEAFDSFRAQKLKQEAFAATTHVNKAMSEVNLFVSTRQYVKPDEAHSLFPGK